MKRYPRPLHKPQGHIAPEIVGTHRMRKTWGLVAGILMNDIVRGGLIPVFRDTVLDLAEHRSTEIHGDCGKADLYAEAQLDFGGLHLPTPFPTDATRTVKACSLSNARQDRTLLSCRP